MRIIRHDFPGSFIEIPEIETVGDAKAFLSNFEDNDTFGIIPDTYNDYHSIQIMGSKCAVGYVHKGPYSSRGCIGKYKKIAERQNMKTFKDLTFLPHHIEGEKAYMSFPNGYGISVLTGSKYWNIDDEHPYECAIMKNGEVCFNNPLRGEVIGHCTKDRVTEIMLEIQSFPNCKKEI